MQVVQFMLAADWLDREIKDTDENDFEDLNLEFEDETDDQRSSSETW